MLSKIPFLSGGLALIATSCALPQPGTRRSSPIDHVLLRGEQLHTERQILEGREINLMTAFGNLASPDNRNLSLQLSSVLEAPEVEGVILKLVRTIRQGNFLIAAYAGAERRGALAIIDLIDPEKPVLRAELQLPTMSIAALAVEGKEVYFAGSSADSSGSAVGRISYLDGEWQDDLKTQALDLQGVEAIALLDDRLVVMDGSRSQLVMLQKRDFATVGQMAVPGLSQLAQDESSLWSLTRQPTGITQHDGQLQPLAQFKNVGTMTSSLSNGQLEIGRETVLATLLDGGVRSFCKVDHQPLFNIPAVTRADLASERTLSMAAALSHGLLLTANADAGIYLYQVSAQDKNGNCKARTVRFEGYLDLGTDFRAESLSWKNGVLSVGDGQGRLNLISIESEVLFDDDVDFDG